MPSLADRLQPFLNRRCSLALSGTKAAFLKSLQIPVRNHRLSLFVFDWDKVSAELKGQMCEEAGQDDFPIFAVINPSRGADELEELISAKNSGFLLYSDDDAIYIGFGEMEPFIEKADDFFSNLTVSSEEESEEESEDGESGGSGGGKEPEWLRLTRDTDWKSLGKEERWEKVKAISKAINWNNYDWKGSPAADLAFPDFTPEEMANKAPWMPKHYNTVSEMEVCHVPDLNQIADGDERKMFATYGVPVAWPSKDKEPRELTDLLDLLDAARAEGGGKWLEEMDSHGLLNDQHYMWLRHYKLGWPKKLSGASDAVDKSLREIDAAAAAGNGKQAFQEYELRDQAHLDAFNVYFAKIKTKAWGAHNEKAKEVYAKLDQQFEKNKSELTGELAPFEGISLADWARSNAKIIQGTSLDSILSGLKIERAVWDSANKEWNARMARDKTFTVATIYGAAFMGDAAFAAAMAKARGQ